MQNVEVANTRNLALIGHTADGKTSLGEALLQAAGATEALGSVDDGSSLLDHSPEERDRHHTLSSSFFAFEQSARPPSSEDRTAPGVSRGAFLVIRSAAKTAPRAAIRISGRGSLMIGRPAP